MCYAVPSDRRCVCIVGGPLRSNVYPGVYPGGFSSLKKCRKPLRHRNNCKKRPLNPRKRTFDSMSGMSMSAPGGEHEEKGRREL